MVNRREMLAVLSALPIGLSALAAETSSKVRMGLVSHSYGIRSKKSLAPEFSDINDPVAFLEHAAKIGAAGVQTRIGLKDDDALTRIKSTIEKSGLYIEGIVGLPNDEADAKRFEAEIKANKSAGAEIMRTVCLGERRYELFESAEQFKAFAERSWTSLRLAEPIMARHKVRLAVENHKDWRVDEMLRWLKRLGSEWVGICLDTGNSVALLEDPGAVIEAYAPYAITTHFKDVAVAEYDDGFLLAEVPLGEGILDLPKTFELLKKAQPKIRCNLEMITRDPLRIPCLTNRYWATLGAVTGRELAAALARARQHKPTKPLPTISTLDHQHQLRTEEANIAKCLAYAREKLTL